MLRPFRPEDADACSALIRACLSNDSTLPLRLRERLQQLETAQAMEERGRLFFVIVYEKAGTILGIAGLDLNEIRILCVSPEHRRSGIGRTLLNYLIEMVPGALFPDVFVYASSEGKEFYQACGFLEKGPVAFDIEGERIPAVFMTLPLR